jgi:type II restriction enzyme
LIRRATVSRDGERRGKKKKSVNAKTQRALGRASKPARGDVLQVVQSLGKLEFTLAEVYAHAGALAKLHPNNAHVRDKIRQQLQVLRDLGLLTFLGSGSYRLS